MRQMMENPHLQDLLIEIFAMIIFKSLCLNFKSLCLKFIDFLCNCVNWDYLFFLPRQRLFIGSQTKQYYAIDSALSTAPLTATDESIFDLAVQKK